MRRLFVGSGCVLKKPPCLYITGSYRKGFLKLHAGGLEAIEQYKATIRLDHYHLGAPTNLALAYERKGLHEKAAEHRRMAEGLEQR